MVSAAGLAPALPRFQAEHVAAIPRAENSGRLIFGNVGVEKRNAENPGHRHRGEIETGGLEGIRTLSLPADNGLLR